MVESVSVGSVCTSYICTIYSMCVIFTFGHSQAFLKPKYVGGVAVAVGANIGVIMAVARAAVVLSELKAGSSTRRALERDRAESREMSLLFSLPLGLVVVADAARSSRRRLEASLGEEALEAVGSALALWGWTRLHPTSGATSSVLILQQHLFFVMVCMYVCMYNLRAL